MAEWRDLEYELDKWRVVNKTATLWWRDDDAVEPTPALEHLIATSALHHVPLALAVIPALAEASLGSRLAEVTCTSVLQHGLAHTNHAPADHKKAELEGHRDTGDIVDDVARGARILDSLCPGVLPVLVPPWNRISNDVAEQLPAIGILGLSTFRSRSEQIPVAGLRITNTHADIIDWRESRDFAGRSKALAQMLDHLSKRRTEEVDHDEPTGLLTHHLVHTEDCWHFLDKLFTLTCAHPAARWLEAREVFSVHQTG